LIGKENLMNHYIFELYLSTEKIRSFVQNNFSAVIVWCFSVPQSTSIEKANFLLSESAPIDADYQRLWE